MTEIIRAVEELLTFGAVAGNAGNGAAPLLLASASNSDPSTLVQRIPYGSADTTDTTVAGVVWGVVLPMPYQINSAAFDYTGASTNVGGQTVQLRVLVNGTIVFQSNALPTTMGEHTFLMTGIGHTGAAGDKVVIQLVLSAPLTTALVLVSAVLSS